MDDLILVKPGEKIPADGVVIEGESYVDESMITGEPVPALKEPGQKVVGGTLNKNGSIKFKATRVGKDTVLAQIITLVEEAQGSRPPVQRIADRAVAYFIPTILAIAAAAFVYWYFVAHNTLLFSLDGSDIRISSGLPLCPGPGHAHRRHCWHRQGSGAGDSHQERRGSGGLGEAQCRGLRQDRHPDGGPAGCY